MGGATLTSQFKSLFDILLGMLWKIYMGQRYAAGVWGEYVPRLARYQRMHGGTVYVGSIDNIGTMLDMFTY